MVQRESNSDGKLVQRRFAARNAPGPFVIEPRLPKTSFPRDRERTRIAGSSAGTHPPVRDIETVRTSTQRGVASCPPTSSFISHRLAAPSGRWRARRPHAPQGEAALDGARRRAGHVPGRDDRDSRAVGIGIGNDRGAGHGTRRQARGGPARGRGNRNRVRETRRGTALAQGGGPSPLSDVRGGDVYRSKETHMATQTHSASHAQAGRCRRRRRTRTRGRHAAAGRLQGIGRAVHVRHRRERDRCRESCSPATARR